MNRWVRVGTLLVRLITEPWRLVGIVAVIAGATWLELHAPHAGIGGHLLRGFIQVVGLAVAGSFLPRTPRRRDTGPVPGGDGAPGQQGGGEGRRGDG